jgi:hypothetical protein
MKYFNTFLLIMSSVLVMAQTPSDFESFEIEVDSFLNGIDADVYQNGDAMFPSFFEDYWLGGWAISSMTDTETTEFTNLYSAKPGTGVEASQNYAVGQQNSVIYLTGDAAGQPLKGVFITNTTYAHGVIRDGNDFSKKFGGESGDDPDYFLLTIKPYAQGQLFEDSLDFYLADYRFENNEEDYIIDDWTYVDLSSLSANVPFGAVDSLLFTLSSTDVAPWGINTPTFYCIDNFNGDNITGTQNPMIESIVINTAPNPTTDWIQVELPFEKTSEGLIQIIDANGKIVFLQQVETNKASINISHLPNGPYWLKYIGENNTGISKILKY